MATYFSIGYNFLFFHSVIHFDEELEMKTYLKILSSIVKLKENLGTECFWEKKNPLPECCVYKCTFLPRIHPGDNL